MPQLLHARLQQQVEGKHELAMRSRDVREVAQQLAGMQRRIVAAILGVGLLVVAAVLYALEAGGPHWLGAPVSTWIAGLGGLCGAARGVAATLAAFADSPGPA